METGAIVSLQKGDEMTGQMVDGRCNSSVIGTGVYTCICRIYTHGFIVLSIDIDSRHDASYWVSAMVNRQ